MERGFDVALICLNGHIVNCSSHDYPQFNKKFCDACGAQTIEECTNCHTAIQGSYRDNISFNYKAPRFCFNCGHPFPWTGAKIQAAHDLAMELESLSNEDRQMWFLKQQRRCYSRSILIMSAATPYGV